MKDKQVDGHSYIESRKRSKICFKTYILMITRISCDKCKKNYTGLLTDTKPW